MNDQLIIILEENTSSSYPKYVQPLMDLNRSVILQLRFGPLFWISFVPLKHDFHNGGQPGKNGNYNIRARPVRPQQNKHGRVSNVRHVASRK